MKMWQVTSERTIGGAFDNSNYLESTQKRFAGHQQSRRTTHARITEERFYGELMSPLNVNAANRRAMAKTR